MNRKRNNAPMLAWVSLTQNNDLFIARRPGLHAWIHGFFRFSLLPRGLGASIVLLREDFPSWKALAAAPIIGGHAGIVLTPRWIAKKAA
jgi:hypothetical protein